MTISRAPGTPHARIRVYDGVPGTRGEWVRTAGRISALLLVLVGAGRDGHPLPDELGGRGALDLWLRISRPVLRAAETATPEDVMFALDADDVAHLARIVDALSGGPDGDPDAAATVFTVLHDEAEVHGCTPADLVDGLRRVHALLA